MIIRHWVDHNGSGMHHAAKAMSEAERRLGHDSQTIDVRAQPDEAGEPEIHVVHTNFPEVAIRASNPPPFKTVFVAHGTPEHVFETTIDQFAHPGYAPGDGWMLLRHWLKEADAVITFWDRHRDFYHSLVPRERRANVHSIPLGVDTEFWAQGKSAKFGGAPSVWMSENQARIKWALDVIIAWPEVTKVIPTACLHAHYIGTALHRFFIDLANTNGAAYRGFFSSATYSHESLRDMWKGFDFFLNPVRYGDHNCIGLQARAAGLPVISYRGNQYADYWITEGDQRYMALELAAILSGNVPPRTDRLPVPSFDDMGKASVLIYEGLLAGDTPPVPLEVTPEVTPEVPLPKLSTPRKKKRKK